MVRAVACGVLTLLFLVLARWSSASLPTAVCLPSTPRLCQNDLAHRPPARDEENVAPAPSTPHEDGPARALFQRYTPRDICVFPCPAHWVCDAAREVGRDALRSRVVALNAFLPRPLASDVRAFPPSPKHVPRTTNATQGVRCSPGVRSSAGATRP